MSYFTDWRIHYDVGWFYGLALRCIKRRHEAIIKLDRWAFKRERKQNLEANHTNEKLSEHQLREAMAWGAGARDAAEVIEPYPSPPYEKGVQWVA